MLWGRVSVVGTVAALERGSWNNRKLGMTDCRATFCRLTRQSSM